MSEQIMNNESSNIVSLRNNQTGHAQNARVLTVENKKVTLQMNQTQSIVEGEVAFSCMVEVKVNDIVVCVQSDSAKYIVIAILERHSNQDMALDFPANVALKAKNGELNVFAKNKMSMQSDHIICASNNVTHKSNHANIVYDNTVAQGQKLNAQFKTVHFLSDMLNTFAKTAMQKFNHYMRRSSEIDQVSAKQMDKKVEGLLTVNSDTSILLSKKDTKIDGERIHMG